MHHSNYIPSCLSTLLFKATWTVLNYLTPNVIVVNVNVKSYTVVLRADKIDLSVYLSTYLFVFSVATE